MKIITHSITLDVASPHTRGRMFEVKRKDGGTHTVNFTLTENGTEITEYDGITSYRIRVLHMDKSSTETQYSNFNGTITHTFSTADLSVFGDALCEVSLYDNSGNRLTSAAFGFFIVPDINTDEGVLSDSNYPVLDNLIKTVNENLADVEKMTASANTLISKADDVNTKTDELSAALKTINNEVTANAKDIAENTNKAETSAKSANSAMSRAETASDESVSAATAAKTAKEAAIAAQTAAETAKGKAETAKSDAVKAKEAAETAKETVETYLNSGDFHTHANKDWLDKLVYIDSYPTYDGKSTQYINAVNCDVFDNMEADIVYSIDVKSQTIWNMLVNNAKENSDFHKNYSNLTAVTTAGVGYHICMICEISKDSSISIGGTVEKATQYFIEPCGRVYSRKITKTVLGETTNFSYSDFKRIDGEDKVSKINGKELSTNDFTDKYKTAVDKLGYDSDSNVFQNDSGWVTSGLVDVGAIMVENEVVITSFDKIKDSTTTLQETLDKKVGFTDYADIGTAGVIKMFAPPQSGLEISDGYISLSPAASYDIDSREYNRAITPVNLDYAVRSVRPAVSTTIPSTLVVNTIYNAGLKESLSLTLPSGQYGDFIQVDFYSGSTPTTLTITNANGIVGYDLNVEANTMYSLYFDYGTVYVKENTAATGWRFGYSSYPHEEV